MPTKKLTHFDERGEARMVDVSGKAVTARTAVARGTLTCTAGTLARVREGKTPKGAVISTAELAGVMGAKRTSDLIPLCHPLALTRVVVEVAIRDDLPGFAITAEARTNGQTGVEMEALTAVSVAALTLYDMLKAVDKDMVIGGIEVVSKRGGKADYDKDR
jgi:cyclic pyranopterin phosphate synthase